MPDPTQRYLDQALDGIWDATDPDAWRYVQLLLSGHDPFEATCIIQATGDDHA
jgi:hypothetical protein